MSSKVSKLEVLVADSDATTITQLKNSLASRGIVIHGVKDSDQALEAYTQNEIDICLFQHDLEPNNAYLLTQLLLENCGTDRKIPGIIISTNNQLTTQDQLMLKDLNQALLIKKPFKLPILIGLFDKANKIREKRSTLLKIKRTVIAPLAKRGQIKEVVQLVHKHFLGSDDFANMMGLKILRDIGQLELSLKLAKDRHKIDPQNPSMMTEVGRSLESQQKYENAITYFEKADEISPNNIERINDLAECYSQAQRHEESVLRYDQLVKLRGKGDEEKFKYYEKIKSTGQEELATNFCRKNATAKEITRHYNNRGIELSKQGRYKEALEEYQNGYKLVTDPAAKRGLLYNMSIAHLNLKSRKDYQLARGLLKKALEIDPTFEKAKTKLEETNRRLFRAS